MSKPSRTWLQRYPASWAYLIASGVLYLSSLALHGSKVVEGVTDLKDAAESGVTLIKDIAALSGTWATGLFAGAAAVSVKGREWSHGWATLDSVIIVTVLACGVLTYYGVYCAYIASLSMVAAGAFNPLAADVATALAIQYYSALTGTLLLGFVFARMLDRRIH